MMIRDAVTLAPVLILAIVVGSIVLRGQRREPTPLSLPYPLTSLGRRRGLVIVMYAFVLLAAISEIGAHGASFVSAGAIVLAAGASALLMQDVGRFGYSPRGALDERHAQRQTWSLATTLRALLCAFSVEFLLLEFGRSSYAAMSVRDALGDANTLVVLLVLDAAIAWSLPIALLAWTEPNAFAFDD
jgi:hypothetical protein